MQLSRPLGIEINAAALVCHKIAQKILERDENKICSGNVEMDDAYWGDKLSGGKRRRGASNKTLFLAAFSKADGKPDQIKYCVIKGFRTDEIKQLSLIGLTPSQET